eukprot:16426270-Heterocapsa_arctica.AAC.1
MKEEQEGVRSRGCAGRAAILRRQVRAEKILFTGIQEARSPEDCRVVEDFLVISSGALRGNLGCELWVDLTLAYASEGGRKLTISEDACTVVHNDPRLLVVRIRAARLQCT